MTAEPGPVEHLGEAGAADIARNCIEIALAGEIAAIEQARRAVIGWLESRNLTPRVINRVEVILEELISNIVRHGTPRTVAPATIQLRASTAADEILIEIEDDCLAFDPRAVAEPDKFTSLDTAKEGGLGIPLVRRLTRRFDYARVTGTDGVGRNRVTVAIAIA